MRNHGRVCRILASAWLTLLVAVAAADVKPVEIHVNPQGSDAAPGTLDAPLATLERARDLAREMRRKTSPPAPLRIVLHGGTYFLRNTFVLTADDSGTDEAPVLYVAYPGEAPVLSGGQPIADWRPATIHGKRLETLVRIEGAAGKMAARAIRFVGLAFRHADSSVLNVPGQAASSIPGAVILKNARDCVFYDCDFDQIGAYAVQVAAGSAGNRFIACRFENLGAGAVRVDNATEHTTVADCVIRRGGRIWPSAVAVLIQDSPRNRILHNTISEFPHTGISCGGIAGYAHTHAFDNRLEYNLIHDLGPGQLDGMGAIITLGTQAGTVIRGNVIHDITSHAGGGWGICTGAGSSFILIEGNLVYRTRNGGFHHYFGRDNIVRNNIFALSHEAELRRSLNERVNSFDFENNIVFLNPDAVLLDGEWGDGHFAMHENIFWCADGGEPEFVEHTLAQWQRMGNDLHSIVADPMFVNPVSGDFTLQAQSPALRRGFRPVDVSRAGPRRLDPRRVALERWPATEESPRPIVEGRLEDENGRDVTGGERFQKPLILRPGRPVEIIYHLWNCGGVPAEGDLVFRILPPEAARLTGDLKYHYALKPDDKAVLHLKVTAAPKMDVEGCRLVAVPHGAGLVPSVIYLSAPKRN